MAIDQITGTECGTEIAKIINRLISEKSDTDLGNLSAIGQAILDGKSSISLDNLSAAGQAILDKKVEVEALLAQNGYAKFSWKENNEISNLIIQWGGGFIQTKTYTPFSFPISFSNKIYKVVTTIVDRGYDNFKIAISNIENTKFYMLTTYNLNTAFYWFAIGY